LPEDPTTFKDLMEIIKPEHYKQSLEKYKLDDQNSLAENYSAVITLYTKLEKYNLEKILGTSLTNYIFKNGIENYMISS
jgi:hypothetical protein